MSMNMKTTVRESLAYGGRGAGDDHGEEMEDI
jgi:hypothetical protein